MSVYIQDKFSAAAKFVPLQAKTADNKSNFRLKSQSVSAATMLIKATLSKTHKATTKVVVTMAKCK